MWGMARYMGDTPTARRRDGFLNVRDAEPAARAAIRFLHRLVYALIDTQFLYLNANADALHQRKQRALPRVIQLMI